MKKILLIDDSDTFTWCLQKYLRRRGCRVETAVTLRRSKGGCPGRNAAVDLL